MKNNRKKGIVNKHFLSSLLIFLGVLIVVLTFISVLEDIQEKNKSNNITIKQKK